MDVKTDSDTNRAIPSGHTPLALRVSMILGFIAGGSNLFVNYVLRGRACHSQSLALVHVVTAVCLLFTISGALLGAKVLRQLPKEKNDEGGEPHDRAHFQALLAIGFNAAFTVVVVAVAIPSWMVQPC